MTRRMRPREIRRPGAAAVSAAAVGAAAMTAAAALALAAAPPARAADFLQTGPYVSDSANHPQPSLAPPTLGASYTDPSFGTRIRRLTATRPGGPGIVPEYSKAGAFNADGSRFLLRGTDGATYLYDGATLSRFARLPLPEGDIEPRWSPSDPNAITYLSGSTVMQYSTATGRSRRLARYRGVGDLSSGAEQDRSRSGRYYALHGSIKESGDGQFRSTKAFVADLKTGRRGPVKVLTPPAAGDFLDYVAITPDDRYVMVMWAGHGADLYTRDWRYVRRLTTWDEHADFCRTPDGKDVLVIARYRPEPNDEVVELVPLDGSPSSVIWQAPAYNLALHISCRNVNLPGWAFISSYWDGIGQRPGPTPFENEVFALSLSSTPRVPVVRRLAQTGMTERADYFDEPHATVRRDGRVVLFASNFDASAADEEYDDTYAIDLR